MDIIKVVTERRCIGCGAICQTTDPKKPGYLPAATLAKAEAVEVIYVQRCFRLRHTKVMSPVTLTVEVFYCLQYAIGVSNACM